MNKNLSQQETPAKPTNLKMKRRRVGRKTHQLDRQVEIKIIKIQIVVINNFDGSFDQPYGRLNFFYS